MKPEHCACGRKLDASSAVFFLDSSGALTGWYWECECGSTHFKPEGRRE
jgi:hypothetical protein